MLYIHDWEKQVSYGNITGNRAREAAADVRIYVRGAHFVNEVSKVSIISRIASGSGGETNPSISSREFDIREYKL